MKSFRTVLIILVLAALFLVLAKRRPAVRRAPVARTDALVLAYPLRQGGWTQIERSVPDLPGPTEDRARRIVRELSAADSDPSVFPPLPETFPLRSVYLDGSRLYLDMDPDALAELSGGSEDEIIALESLTQTLALNLPQLDQLQILVDGQSRRTLGAAGEDAGHISILRPIRLKK